MYKLQKKTEDETINLSWPLRGRKIRTSESTKDEKQKLKRSMQAALRKIKKNIFRNNDLIFFSSAQFL